MEILKKIVLSFFVIMMIFPSMLFAANRDKDIISVQMIDEVSREHFYLKGDSLDLSEMKAEIVYDDLTYETISFDDPRIKIDGFDSSKLGPQTVKIKILDHGAYTSIYSFNANILDQKETTSFSKDSSKILKVAAPRKKSISSVSVVDMPTKKQVYKLGDEIDFEGLVIGILYSNDTYEEVEYDDYRLNYKYDKDEVGAQSVYVRLSNYKEYYYLFDIIITNDNEKVITELNLVSTPKKMEYLLGEELDLTGGAIEIVYSDGTSETYRMNNDIFKVYNYMDDTIGSKLVIIQLKDDAPDEVDFYKKYVYFDVLVYNDEDDDSNITAYSKNYNIGYNDLNGSLLNSLYTMADSELPSKYNMSNKFLLKAASQGVLGLCAAFATNKGIETNYMYSYGKMYDLSERYIDYMTSQYLYGTRDDIGSIQNKVAGEGIGFPDEIPILEMYGTVLESDAPYRDYSSDEISNLANIENTSKLRSSIFFSKVSPISAKYEIFKNTIKKHVMNYGSMYICIVSPNQTGLYDKNTYAYHKDINEPKTGSLHAVSIVGWDDNYSKDNFITKPEHDGAWIALNSWGDTWGDSGYFYISYETDFVYMFGTIDTDKSFKTNEYTYSKELLKDNYTKVENDNTRYYYVEFEKKNNIEYLDNIVIPNSINCGSDDIIKVYICDDYDGTNISNNRYLGRLSSQTVFGACNLVLEKPIKLVGDKFLIIIEADKGSQLPMHESDIIHTYYSDDSISNSMTLLDKELSLFVYTMNATEYSKYMEQKNITSIEVDTLPDQTVLISGDAFSLNGGKIKVNYADGSNEIINMTDSSIGYYGITPTSPLGENTVTVCYQKNKVDFNVTIKDLSSNNDNPSGDASGEVISSGDISGEIISSGDTSGESPNSGDIIVKQKYTITVTTPSNGTITPSTVIAEEGTDKAFIIKANSGYTIKDVLVDGSSVGKVSLFTFKNINKNHTITATFEKEQSTSSGGGRRRRWWWWWNHYYSNKIHYKSYNSNKWNNYTFYNNC